MEPRPGSPGEPYSRWGTQGKPRGHRCRRKITQAQEPLRSWNLEEERTGTCTSTWSERTYLDIGTFHRRLASETSIPC